MQYVGTDLLRDNLELIMPGLGKNIFIHNFEIWYQEELIKNPNICVVVSDIRFQNEADFIKKIGGIIIKIDRYNGYNDTHESEIELEQIKNYDYIIDNHSDINHLYENLEDIVEIL